MEIYFGVMVVVLFVWNVILSIEVSNKKDKEHPMRAFEEETLEYRFKVLCDGLGVTVYPYAGKIIAREKGELGNIANALRSSRDRIRREITLLYDYLGIEEQACENKLVKRSKRK